MEENKVEVNHIKTNKQGKPVLIVVLIILALLIGGIALYFGVLTNPVNIYQGIVSSVIDGLFEENSLGEAKGKQGVTLEYDLTLNVEDEEFKKIPSVKALNAIDVIMDIQADNDKNEFVINIDSTYDDEELLKASVFMNLEQGKMYIYAKEIIDKYLEVDVEIAADEDNEETNGLSYEIRKIIKDELKNIITEDMCSKEDGAYVLKTTNIELIDNIVNAIENLAKNEEFLKASNDPDGVVELLEAYIEMLDTTLMEECEIEIILDLDLLLNPKKIVAKIDGESTVEALATIGENKLNFDVKLDDEKIVDGDLSLKEVGKTQKIKLDLEIEEFGRAVLDLALTPKEVKVLDKVNTSKVKKLDELSFNETMDLLSKLEESKLGQVITEIAEYNSSIINKANQAVIQSDLANLRAELSLEYANIYLENFEADNDGKANTVGVTQQEANIRYENILANYQSLIELGCTVYADSDLRPIVIEPDIE